MIAESLLALALAAPADPVTPDREAAATRPSRSAPAIRDAASMHGIRPSTYTGHYYTTSGERFRLCVIRRESNGNYDAANPSSSARGAYQFLGAWQWSLPYMVADALRREGVAGRDARRIRVALQRIPINHWSREIQDIAFFAAYRFGAGRHHWAGGNYAC